MAAAAYPYPPTASVYAPDPDFCTSHFGASTTSLVGAPVLGSSAAPAYGPFGFSSTPRANSSSYPTPEYGTPMAIFSTERPTNLPAIPASNMANAGAPAGRVVMVPSTNEVPYSAEHFRALCTGEDSDGKSINGAGCESIPDERLVRKHTGSEIFPMSSAGPDHNFASARSPVLDLDKSTDGQPDFQQGATFHSSAFHVFDGMPTASYGMGSGLSSSLQWNQSNIHTGQHHQILDRSSCPDYETSAMTCSYCPTLRGRVLSVVIHQVKHPVPIDVFNHLFSIYGVVEMIFQSLNQHGRKLLIQYQHSYMADNALRATNGWYLYCTYCQLDIKHADPTELQILDDYSGALFSEINNDAGHLSHDTSAIPQEEVSVSSQPVTPHMKGHISEQQVQNSIPVFSFVTNGTHEQQLYEEDKPETMQTSKYLRKASEKETHSSHSAMSATVTGLMQFQAFERLPMFDVYDDESDGCSNEFVQVFTCSPEQQTYEVPENYPLPQATSKQMSAVYDKKTEGESDESTDVFTTTPKQQPHEEERQEGVQDYTLELQQKDDERACNCPVIKASDSSARRSSHLSLEHIMRELRLLWDPGASAFFVIPLNNGSSNDTIGNEHVGQLVSSASGFSSHDTDLWSQSELRGVFEEVMLDKPPAKPPDRYGIADSSLQVILVKVHKVENSSAHTHFNLLLCNSKQLSDIQAIQCNCFSLEAIPSWQGGAFSLGNFAISVFWRTATPAGDKIYGHTAAVPVLAAPHSKVTYLAKHSLIFLFQDTHEQEQLPKENEQTSTYCSKASENTLERKPVYDVFGCVLEQHQQLYEDKKLSMEKSDAKILFTCPKKAPVGSSMDVLLWSQCPVLADLQYQLLSSNVWDPGIGASSSMYHWLQTLTAANETKTSNMATSSDRCFVCMDTGTILLQYKLLFTEEKEMVALISEQWSFKYNAMHYCEIFQRCTTMSSLFHCQGIPLWLIHFQPP